MSQRQRRLLVIGGCFLPVAVLAGLVVSTPQFQKWVWPPVLVLPPADEVVEMRASIRGSSEWGRKEIPEFVVPSEHIPLIIRWLQPARYDGEPGRRILPDEWEIGQICLKSKDGQEVRIRVYDFGKNPAMLTTNGEDYFWAPFDESQIRLSIGGLGLRYEIEKAFQASRQPK
ncbi:MAG: hypothetical protein L0241_12585 [Planctomycetia bacterium]|nr:hypothetical protein [Planctomycetia bacterium]